MTATDPQKKILDRYTGHRAAELALVAADSIIEKTMQSLQQYRVRLREQLKGQSTATEALRDVAGSMDLDLSDKALGDALVEGANAGTLATKQQIVKVLKPVLDYIQGGGFSAVPEAKPERVPVGALEENGERAVPRGRKRPKPGDGTRTTERRHATPATAMERQPTGGEEREDLRAGTGVTADGKGPTVKAPSEPVEPSEPAPDADDSRESGAPESAAEEPQEPAAPPSGPTAAFEAMGREAFDNHGAISDTLRAALEPWQFAAVEQGFAVAQAECEAEEPMEPEAPPGSRPEDYPEDQRPGKQ